MRIRPAERGDLPAVLEINAQGFETYREFAPRPSHFGGGVATALMQALVGEAVRRGYEEMRLFTPAEQHRARRFYEREGWREVGRGEETPLGFPVVEYRLRCPTRS